MARGRSRVDKGSDIRAPHPFLIFFFSYLFSFLGGLEPPHTPVRSPAPLPAPLPSPQPLQVSPPLYSTAFQAQALPPHVPDLVVSVPAPRTSPAGPRPFGAAHGGARGRRGGRRVSDPFSPFPLWPLKRWLCSQVDVPHVECKDQQPQPLGESKERQQCEESREDEAGPGSAR